MLEKVKLNLLQVDKMTFSFDFCVAPCLHFSKNFFLTKPSNVSFMCLQDVGVFFIGGLVGTVFIVG